MALPFVWSDAALLGLQAAVVGAPRVPPRVPLFQRLRGPAWAIVPIASIVVTIFAIRYVSDTATGLTYLALIAVPPLAAVGLGWAVRGSVPWAALGAVPLFALAWWSRTTLVGEAAAALLSGLSCVTLGVLLGAVTPAGWLKIGIVLMAAADTWLVVSDLLQAPNAVLVNAHPAAGLPQLQSELFGTVSMGYGDLFVAALLGAALAPRVRVQRAAAVMVFVFAALFDLLFFVVAELPATVPVALVVIVLEVWDRLGMSERVRGGPRRRDALGSEGEGDVGLRGRVRAGPSGPTSGLKAATPFDSDPASSPLSTGMAEKRP